MAAPRSVNAPWTDTFTAGAPGNPGRERSLGVSVREDRRAAVDRGVLHRRVRGGEEPGTRAEPRAGGLAERLVGEDDRVVGVRRDARDRAVGGLVDARDRAED